MRFHAVAALCVAALSLAALTACDGCDRRQAAADAGATQASSATTAVDAGAPAMTSAVPAREGAHAIDGVGDVPRWSPDHFKAKACSPSPAALARYKAIEKGDDPQLLAGTADAAALMKEVGADDCFAARKGLAEAVNNGAYKRYGLGRFEEASRFWRVSLTVRPAFLLARYNLACGLGRAGRGKDAVVELLELARAATEGDASAANFLEKAKTDDDLVSVREDPAFKEAVKASQGDLVGPRKGTSEPELGKKAIPLLPEELRRGKTTVASLWTWRPSADVELVITSITGDTLGALAVYRRDGEKLTLLVSRKTGEVPPAVAAGRNGTVAYTFEQACGTLSGILSWDGKSVEVKEKTCQDL